MSRIALSILALSLICAHAGCAAKPKEGQAKAIAAIEKLGGRVTVDEKSPGKPVVGVRLSDANVTDADLEHIEALTNLRRLDLFRTKVTDVGLEHLTGLTQLQTLDLSGDHVTDAGLKFLKGLTELQTLKIFRVPR